MKILYGVQGTGNGHITRSRVMVKELRLLRHEVDVLVSGRSHFDVSSHDDLHTDIIFPGLTFVSEKGKINILKTITRQKPFSFIKGILGFNASSYDLIITDFEPLTSRIAKLHHITSIGIGHQYAFLYDIPKDGGNIITNLIMKEFAAADIEIGLHWSHFNAPICPPIVPELPLIKPVNQNKIVVYLPFEDLNHIENFFAQFAAYDFFIYYDIADPMDSGNLHFRPFSKEGFKRDLVTCNGVISNAGFELPSETLSLGKKILVKPLGGQLEQISNATALTKLGLGSTTETLDSVVVAEWLTKPNPKAIHYGPVAKIISQWISDGDWGNTQDLSERTWQR